MSTEITTAFVQEYCQGVDLLVQQKESRLRNTVDIKTGIVGKRAYLDQVGVRNLPDAVSSRHGDSPQNDTPHDRRALDLTFYDDGDYVDDPDARRTLNEMTNPYTMAMAAAFGRRMDNVIISAATGTALSGETGATSNTLPATQQVAVDYVENGSAADSNLTVAKIREAKRILDANEVPDGDRFFAYTASALNSLLRDSEITSSDFNTIKALVNGELNYYLGFTFVRTELLSIVSATNVRSCLAYHKSGIKLGIGQDITGRITERPDKRFSTYIYYAMDLGAVRMEEEKVVEVLADEDL